MKISTDLVKKLRIITGIGILDCKRALLKKNGDINSAVDYLRKKGKSKALNKLSRKTFQGSIFSGIKKDFGILLELNCETDFVSKDNYFINFGKKIIKFLLDKKIDNLNLLRDSFESERVNLVSMIGENIKISRISALHGDFIHSYVHCSRIGVLLKSNSKKIDLNKNISMHIAASNPLYLNPLSVPENIILRERNIQLSMSKQVGKPQFIAKKIVEGRMNKFFGEITLIKQPFVINPKQKVEDFLLENNIIVKNFVRFELGENKI
ncbi:MAG: elongation factor Ts [Buchnera aphidicola (Periphyllus acericola)]|uniref:translation elongation factor Ts n=1 Tax=Buchnera aphidicola TaxID=9 RepID=UPI0030CCF1CF|nr:elongation factor Ts [Buchnera aphidicola (Periphyllus acericola)]